MKTEAKGIYEFGPFSLDGHKRLLLRNGQPVSLPAKAFDVLLLLVQHNGEVLEKDDLMNRVWPDQIVEEANLTVNMSSLRKALGETPNERNYIVTIPGRGYRFVAEVREVSEAPTFEAALVVEQGARARLVIEEQEQSVEAEAQWGREALARAALARRRATPGLVAVSGAFVALLAAAIYFAVSSRSKPPEVGSAVKSIAVLPFKPIGAEPRDEVLELGMADTLITKLSNLRQIIVRPTSAVRKYTELEQDPVAAGRELQVDSVLEGSVQQSGEEIRVSVRLVSVRDGASLWAAQFDEKSTNIFAVQSSISEQAARALAVRLTSEEKERLAARSTGNLEAYQLYLKGRYFLSRRTEEEIKKSIKYFQQAIDLDPNYALAFAGLADSYRSLGGVLGFLPPPEFYPRAKAAAEKALKIDETLAEAHTSLAGYRLEYEWDWPAAEREYRRAIDLNPNYAPAHQAYGGYLRVLERFDEAIAERKRAEELDPVTPITVADVGYPFYHARQYDQAIAHYRRALELDPNFSWSYLWIGQAYVQKGMYEEAITEIQKALTLSPGNTRALATLGHAYAVAGKRGEARKVLDQLKEQAKRQYVSPYFIAVIYTGLGEKDQAFAWLEKAYEERHPYLTLLKVEPVFDSLRPDPRCADLLRRMGLPP